MANTNPIVRAVKTFFAGEVKVARGSLVRVGHDVHKGFEAYFTPLRADFDYDVAEYEARAKKIAQAEVLQLEPAVKADVAKAEVAVKADVKKAVSDAEAGKAAS